ncbi:MAG: hypothetical protein ACO3I1_04030 [Burkholderiales bacterium]
MSERDYSNNGSGVLFKTRSKKSQNSADVFGSVSIPKPLLKQLVDHVKAGGEAKIGFNGWEKKSAAGTDFISLSSYFYVEPEKTEEVDPF